jgi:hypothetical protein
MWKYFLAEYYVNQFDFELFIIWWVLNPINQVLSPDMMWYVHISTIM